MKLLFYSILASITFLSIKFKTNLPIQYKNDDHESLVGRWEPVRAYYEGKELFNIKNLTKDEVETSKKNFLHFKVGGKVTGGVWIKDQNIKYEATGIYELDNPTGRIRIEIRHDDQPIPWSGSFYWKINENNLYLYSTNNTHTYNVYQRAE